MVFPIYIKKPAGFDNPTDWIESKIQVYNIDRYSPEIARLARRISMRIVFTEE